MRKAATFEEYREQWDRFEAALKRLWHRLRRRGWRIERSDPSILWYREDEILNVWFDWLDMEVEIEKGRWKNFLSQDGFEMRRSLDSVLRVSFEDFENGNYKI